MHTVDSSGHQSSAGNGEDNVANGVDAPLSQTAFSPELVDNDPTMNEMFQTMLKDKRKRIAHFTDEALKSVVWLFVTHRRQFGEDPGRRR